MTSNWLGNGGQWASTELSSYKGHGLNKWIRQGQSKEG
jgi:hypothetical protein